MLINCIGILIHFLIYNRGACESLGRANVAADQEKVENLVLNYHIGHPACRT
jgi:hypothetical protein